MNSELDPTRNPFSSRFPRSRLMRLCLDDMNASAQRRALLMRGMFTLLAHYLDDDEDEDEDEEEEDEDPQEQGLYSDSDSGSSDDEFMLLCIVPLLFIAGEQDPLANRKRRRSTTRNPNDDVPRKAHAGPHSPSLTSDAESPFKPEKSLVPRTKPDTSFILHPKNPEMESPEQIFILSGQSNMAGRGGVIRDHGHNHHQHWDGVVPSEAQPDPSILRLNAHLHWEAAREPLHADIDAKKVCGLGPGMSFANAVRGRVEGKIGLVPCAVGGTAIKEWARGEHPYENMVKRARESVKNGGEIKGLLWYQGESDTSSQHDVDAYHENMVRLIENVRHDLALPSLPIIQVAICSGDEKFLEKIREVQLGMKVENVVCVDAKGLELKDDHLHLTTKAQVQLGQMLADAYLKHFGSANSHHPAL
ncbi:probable carbohydrate esterase At4g34215 isoform X1 [Rosa rugosa]|uniref:probable carbohydrate esterase At4g34215 isoform X1 n=1 Tax=Rosa rugosa TaxID=74645 RepID=UPI002B403769|nr:probable carbohydrate esterase At4g34215 isoform X1 [Rosa rugosa]